jgi:hypothetical protein
VSKSKFCCRTHSLLVRLHSLKNGAPYSIFVDGFLSLCKVYKHAATNYVFCHCAASSSSVSDRNDPGKFTSSFVKIKNDKCHTMTIKYIDMTGWCRFTILMSFSCNNYMKVCWTVLLSFHSFSLHAYEAS